MALINCKECGKSISSDAKACPQCGAKCPKQIGVTGIVFALIFSVMVFQCVLPRESPPVAQVANKTTEQKSAEKAALQPAQKIRTAEDAKEQQRLEQQVKEFLQDPKPIISKVRYAIEKKDWQTAINLAKDYQGTNNEEIKTLSAMAIEQYQKDFVIAYKRKEAKRKRCDNLFSTADAVLFQRGKGKTRVIGEDSNGLIVEWVYPDCVFTMKRDEMDGVMAYRVMEYDAR